MARREYVVKTTVAEARRLVAAIDQELGHPTRPASVGRGIDLDEEARTGRWRGWTITECHVEVADDGESLIVLTERAKALQGRVRDPDGEGDVTIDVRASTVERPAKFAERRLLLESASVR